MIKTLLFVIIALIIIFIIYYVISHPVDRTDKGSSLSNRKEEAKAKSQLTKQDLKDSSLGAKEDVETRLENAKHELLDSVDDMRIHTELLDKELKEKTDEVKEEIGSFVSDTKDKIELKFGDVKVESELLRDDLSEKVMDVKDEVEEVKDNILDLNNTIEADLDNTKQEVIQGLQEAFIEENENREDIDDIPREKRVIRSFKRKR